ncbi:MAG: hypothetical protein AMJ62_05810 [Myxococcales bacterium SG8_38]|nr:MAG: hypothetical protein AMJ62_05810 [Myxococcales bacterium SG8_38]
MYSSDADDLEITIHDVDLESYLKELSSFGAGMPATDMIGANGPAPAAQEAQAEGIQRTLADVLEYARDAEEPVEVVLDVGDLPFPELPRWSTIDGESRKRVVADRKAAIERGQENLKRFLDELGARTTKPTGLLNHLHAWIPPEAVPEVADHPDVRAIYPAWQSLSPLYDLEELREATFLSEYWDQDKKGERASRTCEPAEGYDDIKIAVIEPSIAAMFFPNGIDRSHPGWADCEFGVCESRIRSVFNCSLTATDAESCRPWAGEPQEFSNHGTWVSSIAAGDLTQGQDPNTTDPYERRTRTGVAPEASILYLTANSTGFLSAAIASAFLLGADVINLSLGVAECSHDLKTDCGGLNQVIRTVTEGGALIVAAAGNEQTPTGRCRPGSDCSVCYPAIRPSVVAVGNVETARGLDYDLADIAETSSRGTVTVGIGGRYSALFPEGVAIPVVSIAAPGNLCSYFSEEGTYDEIGRSGTSFAAPVIAAGAGLVREEFGPAVRDARMLKSHILAMGDGTDAETPSRGVAVGMSSTWGAGRVKFHSFESMESPKGIAHRSFHLRENERAILTAADTKGERFDPRVTQWKMGMYIDASDLSGIPYVLISYHDTCNGRRIIAADLEAGLERHAVLESPAVNQACLEIRVYGYSVPEGGVEVFVTDYYHSGDPAQH